MRSVCSRGGILYSITDQGTIVCYNIEAPTEVEIVEVPDENYPYGRGVIELCKGVLNYANRNESKLLIWQFDDRHHNNSRSGSKAAGGTSLCGHWSIQFVWMIGGILYILLRSVNLDTQESILSTPILTSFFLGTATWYIAAISRATSWNWFAEDLSGGNCLFTAVVSGLTRNAASTCWTILTTRKERKK